MKGVPLAVVARPRRLSVTISPDRSLLVVKRRTRLFCRTCWATYGNGLKIVGTQLIPVRLKLAALGNGAIVAGA